MRGVVFTEISEKDAKIIQKRIIDACNQNISHVKKMSS
jgi:hypothetical protein